MSEENQAQVPERGWLRGLYDRTLRLSDHRHAVKFMGLVSFAESSFFPVPPDFLMIPMILADRSKAWRIATVASITSVLGGLFGYLIGAVFYDAVGRPLVELYGLTDDFEVFRGHYEEWGAWIVAAAGFTPIPYKVFTIASGLFSLNLLTFVLASALSRAARFFIVAGLLYVFGPPIKVILERYLPWVAAVAFALLFFGFLILGRVLTP